MGAERTLLHRQVFPVPCEEFFPLPAGATHYASRRLVDGPAVDFWRFGSERSRLAEARAAYEAMYQHLRENGAASWPHPQPYDTISALVRAEADAAAREEGRLEGFADCEALIQSMLEGMATLPNVGGASMALLGAAVAVRMGQHKREADHG